MTSDPFDRDAWMEQHHVGRVERRDEEDAAVYLAVGTDGIYCRLRIDIEERALLGGRLDSHAFMVIGHTLERERRGRSPG